MTDSPPPAITRDQLMGGLSARRAATVLYTLESRAAYLSLQARQATGNVLEERTAETEERAFLAAMAAGRSTPVEPRIQDIERFADELVPMVPANPALRVELAHRLGEKYRFRATDVPQLRVALDLDGTEVPAAHLRRYGEPIESIYDERLGWADRWRWTLSRAVGRLDELPPFWSAFGLTLTETVGAGVLAIPLALALVGPLAGVALIIALGLVNILTVAGVAESFTRNGEVRYGNAYFGRVVRQYLGRPSSIVLTCALVVHSCLMLLAYSVGLALGLEDSTGIDAPIWVGVLLAAVVFMVRRKTIDATMASALGIGALNIVLLLVISVIALTHLEIGNITAIDVPGIAGPSKDEAFDPLVLELVFGVLLNAYFGHTTVAQCARTVLRRDPGGRSLILGTAAAMASAMVLYVVWIISVGGAVDAQRLAGETGTAIGPLADVAGPVILVLGAIFAVSAMGMGALNQAEGLASQTREWIPAGRLASTLELAPIVVTCLLATAFLVRDQQAFATAISLIGVISAPLLGGILPVLLLRAARMRSELLPVMRVPLLGGAAMSIVVFGFYLVAVILHGLVIFESPVSRVVVLFTAGVIIGMTVTVMRSRRLDPAVVIEVRTDDESGRTYLSVLDAGEPADAKIRVQRRDGTDEWTGGLNTPLPDRLVSFSVAMTNSERTRLELWAHRSALDGMAQPLPVTAILHVDGTESAPLVVEGQKAFAAPGGRPWVLEASLGRRQATQSTTGASR